jgi:hypothetical protein
MKRRGWSVGWAAGLVGSAGWFRGVCEVDSGREHRLAQAGLPVSGGLLLCGLLFFVVCARLRCFCVQIRLCMGVCPVFVGVSWVGVVFVECLCLASIQGHMVDALASRADEGRWSLR